MKKDFTFEIYEKLIVSLIKHKYDFLTFKEFLLKKSLSKNEKIIILRHDVDKKPENSLKFSEIQNQYNIKGTYYFRALPCSWDEKIIEQINSNGHEIGYHYENMDIANGDIKEAYKDFKSNLQRLRKLSLVKTICMHGSPSSKFDNKALWGSYDYKSLDIIGEPYFDTDFSEVFYLTDTGRSWNGGSYSVRDKVSEQDIWSKMGYIFYSTPQIIKSIESDNFPKKTMFTFHPQRWTNKTSEWYKELILQNLKNKVKKYFFVKK